MWYLCYLDEGCGLGDVGDAVRQDHAVVPYDAQGLLELQREIL